MPVVGPRFSRIRSQRPQAVFAPATPTRRQQTLTVALAVQSRLGAQRRFPLQGWDEGEVFASVSGAFPSTPILDNFNRADEDPLSGGGNWANLDPTSGDHFELLSN